MKHNPIYYVEDDENDVFLMNRAFKECGISNALVISSDGQQAIDTLAALSVSSKAPDANFPGLILLDLNLPRKTGHDVLRWIRQTPGLSNIIVVVLSSSSHDLDVHKAYSLGANAYVVKPPTFDALLETVKTIRDFWLKLNLAPPRIPPEGGACKATVSPVKQPIL